MTTAEPRNIVKEFLGRFPGSAELYQALRPGVVPAGGYGLEQIVEKLPSWVASLEAVDPWVAPDQRRRLLIVGSLKWWLEYGIVLGLLLKSGGHVVDLAYLPYRDWTHPVTRFDALRGAQYIERQLRRTGIPLGLKSLQSGSLDALDAKLRQEMEAQATLDVQYTLQREDIDLVGDSHARDIYRLRLNRNQEAAAGAYNLIKDGGYDTIIIPNGSILEFGAVYRVARHLGVTAVTYEFGEQRERLWLAQDNEVMRQDTSALWQAVQDIPLKPAERQKLGKLFQARRGGMTWEQFGRRWQSGVGEGAQRARQTLCLDADRPMVLLCTNVVGDSLALNRQIFTKGMADWLSRTVALFGDLPDYQLVVRVHPGEMLGAGHPSVEIVKDALPHQPEHVIVVPPESEINTYDLIEIAHLGLVYTTTVGLELSMHGVPVVVAGSTHYRGKGFTEDPDTWDEYVQAINARLIEVPGRPISEDAIELAWRYAYRFFFDLPFPFPWHLISFWKDLSKRPLEDIVKSENLVDFQTTLNGFAGQPIDWRAKAGIPKQVEVVVEG